MEFWANQVLYSGSVVACLIGEVPDVPVTGGGAGRCTCIILHIDEIHEFARKLSLQVVDLLKGRFTSTFFGGKQISAHPEGNFNPQFPHVKVGEVGPTNRTNVGKPMS